MVLAVVTNLSVAVGLCCYIHQVAAPCSGTLVRFPVPDSDTTYVLLWQDEEGNANLEMALKNPTLYVLKPQREGGGKSLLLMIYNCFNTISVEVMLMLLYVGDWSL